MKINSLSSKKLVSFFLLLTILAGTFGIIPVSAQSLVAEWNWPNTRGITVDDVLNNEIPDHLDLEPQWGSKETGYTATNGIQKGEALLWTSVNGTDSRKLEWDEFNDFVLPSFTGSNSNPWTWTTKKAPYIKAKINGTNFTNITVSFSIAGSNTAPYLWDVQYSTDDITYTTTNIKPKIENNNTAYKWENIPLSTSKTNNMPAVWVRIYCAANTSINGGTVNGNKGGRIGISNLSIHGRAISSVRVIKPMANVPDGSKLFNDTPVSFYTYDTIGTGDNRVTMKYRVDGGAVQTFNTANKTFEFAPFILTDKDTCEVEVWATDNNTTNKRADSEVLKVNYIFRGDNIASFAFNGSAQPLQRAIGATGGRYSNLSKLTASFDGINTTIPRYDEQRGPAVKLSPQDTSRWRSGGYWQFETSTAGHENIKLSLDACSSRLGPKSASLKYSLDGINFTTLETNKPFAVTNFGYNYYENYELPSLLNNKEKIYIRLVFEEDKRADPDPTAIIPEPVTLFDDDTSGNNYINNVYIGGRRIENAESMPVTSKIGSKFKLDEGIAYTATKAGSTIKYDIFDKNYTKIVSAATYSAPIVLSALEDYEHNTFTIKAWSESGSNKSIENSRTFSYEGSLITAFNYTTSTNVDGKTEIPSNSGVMTGKLTMLPDAINPAKFTFSESTIYVTASDNTLWTFDKTRNDTNLDGYWLIETSTTGYRNLSISLDQLSTNRGPNDWILSCSTDGDKYTDIPNSQTKVYNARYTGYVNFDLPEALYNQEKVFIKVKLNSYRTAGDNEIAYRLDETSGKLVPRGNTGINKIELYGILGDPPQPMLQIIPDDPEGKEINQEGTYQVILSNDVPKSTLVVVAKYSDFTANKLAEVKVFQANTEKIEFTPEIGVDTEEYARYIKVMLIDGFGNIKPLYRSIDRSTYSD